tara:strand:+ start:732 stop:1001 length:270 start_codon:yes stop_codon:yes gene_type:complete
MKHEAIYKLYPNVVSIDEKEDGNFVCCDIDNNIIEITDWDAVNEKAEELQTEHDDKVHTNKTNKVSAYRKMEMTDEEILAVDQTLEDYL